MKGRGFLFRFFVGPFLDKRLLAQGIEVGSMLRWSVWIITLAEAYRLVTIHQFVGYAEAALVVFVLVALRVNEAAPAAVVGMVARIFGREQYGGYGGAGSWMDRDYGSPGVLPGNLLVPPVEHGRPLDEDGGQP